MRNLLTGVLFFVAAGTLLAGAEFVSVWKITDADLRVELPVPHGFNYDFVVDWGDGASGQVTAWDDEDATHTYAQAGTYTITISGLVEAWSFWKVPHSRDMIITVNDLGSVGWRSFFGAFLACKNLTLVAGGDTSQVTDMRYMFHLAPLATPDTSGWNTAKVTDMAGMFWRAPAADPDVSGWNTAEVRDMSFMFAGANTAKPEVSNWQVAQVKSMRSMFYRAAAATPNMNAWNFAQISDLHRMFWGVTLPTDIYSNMLVQLSATAEAKDVLLHGGYSKYNTAGAAARQELMARGWVLIDGGRAQADSTPEITDGGLE